MLDGWLRFVLHQKLLVILGGILLMGAGLAAWNRLPIDAFPDVTNVQVMVLADARGLTPGEVERLVTLPIEIEMGGLPGVRQVRSLSRSGLSQVVVVFEDNVDTYFARQMVFERLARAKENLPEGLDAELGPISTGLGEIYQYALETGFYCPKHQRIWSPSAGKCETCGSALIEGKYDLMELRTIQDWLIAPQLRRLSGINEVNSFGGYVKQYQVIPDPAKLLKFKITLREILEALEANNANASGGFIVKDWEQSYLVSKGLLQGISDIGQIVLKAQDGTPVYLKDVAEIRHGGQTRMGAVTKDGRGEVVVGMAIMLKGSNSKQVVDRVRREVPEIQKSLPPGVRIVPFYDRTDLIQACIRTMSEALAQGAILVIVVLFLLLWDLRAALTVAITLPLTAAATFLLMGQQGLTANLMSLGGLAIAIGMLVDGSIVVTENVVRHMHDKADSGQSRTEIAFEALREVARPVCFAMLIIIVVFLPLFTLQSMEGKMFKPLALTICFAMIGSVAVTLSVIPVLASLLAKRVGTHGRENPLVRMIQAAYMPILALALRGRWITLAVAAATMVGSLSVLPGIGTEFLPPLNEGALAINAVRLPTASLEGSVRQSSVIERRLLERIPEIQTVVSKTGRAEIAEDPMGPEQTDLFIMLRPQPRSKPGRTKDELVQAVARELSAIPGMRPAFSQPIALRVNELISGIKADVAVKVFGDDIDILRATGEKVAPVLSQIPGAKDVKIEQVSGLAQIEIKMDREAMARHKVNVADINLLIEAAVGGKVATTLYEGQKRFAVLVRFPEDQRADISTLERLLVPSPLGYNVPLGQLGTIQETEAPAQISREDFRRRIVVECNVRGRDIGSFVAEARQRLLPIESALPEGYRFVWGGQFENQQRAMARLKVVVPVVLLLIFLMLYSSLNSFRSALLIFLNLPFALVGGILTLYWLHINMSVATAIGFIALFGVAVGNGLVLVTFFEQLRAEGRHTTEAVLEACRLRVRPLLMTTMTAVLGLLPLLYATGPGSEIQKPLAAVIFGGLAGSLALTLIILPVLYSVFTADRSTT